MNIFKRGNIYWCKFRVDNKLYQYSCKTKDKSVAQEVAAALHADVIRQEFDIPKKYQSKKEFAEIFKDYLKVANSSETKGFLSKHFLQFFNNKNLKDIGVSDIKNYQFQRKLEVLNLPKNKGKKESEITFRTINYEIAILRNFFNFCVEKGYVKDNPAVKIKKLNELSRLKTLSDSDIGKLINGATNKLTKDLITFLIYTGCRKGEALNLKWDDVDLQNDVIAIKGTKTKYDRYIPISKPLKELLSRIEKVQDVFYVFNRNEAKLTDFKRSFHTACKNAGLKDMHIHDLRHVFASTLTMNDVSLYKTGILLGHRTPGMTQRYAHLKPGDLKKEIEKSFSGKSPEDLRREEYEKALEIIREYEKNGGK